MVIMIKIHFSRYTCGWLQLCIVMFIIHLKSSGEYMYIVYIQWDLIILSLEEYNIVVVKLKPPYGFLKIFYYDFVCFFLLCRITFCRKK